MDNIYNVPRKNQNRGVNFDTRFFKLIETLSKLASTINGKALIKEICEKANELVSATNTHVRIIDWKKDVLDLTQWNSKDDIESKFQQFFPIHTDEAIAGWVFREGKSKVTPNIQEEPEFLKYFNRVQKDANNKDVDYKKFIEYLKSIGPAIVVPLRLDMKIVGVLIVTRIKEKEGDPLPEPFNDADKRLIENFAAQVAISLRDVWLFEAITWQPKPDHPIANLCQEVVAEALQKTGAKEGQVRFLGWNEKSLAPGTQLHHDDYVELAVCKLCVCEEGVCTACRVAKEKEPKPLLINDLEKDKLFKEFKSKAKVNKDTVTQALKDFEEYHRNLSLRGEGGSFNINTFLTTECQKISKTTPDVNKRFDILKNVSSNGNKFDSLLQKQIEVLKELSRGWETFVTYLEALKAEVAVPILHGNKLLGVLSMNSECKKWFTESDKLILQVLANRVADMVMVHQQKILESLQEIGCKMADEWVYDKVADLIATGIKNKTFFETTQEIYPLLYTCENPTRPEILKSDTHFGEKFKPQQRDSATVEEIKLLEVPIRNGGLGKKAIEELAQDPKKSVFIVCENVDDPISSGSDTARGR